jgi:thiamine pyrophosphate-dependent acetolactate synthase large subunit-like protein
MLDVLKSIGFEYVSCNPASSFRGLHESMINYGGNKSPEWLTCCHEESSVAMAHGYAKIEGKPMLALVHGNIGIQHASMAVYNAYADRVPVFMIAGNWRSTTQTQKGSRYRIRRTVSAVSSVQLFSISTTPNVSAGNGRPRSSRCAASASRHAGIRSDSSRTGMATIAAGRSCIK